MLPLKAEKKTFYSPKFVINVTLIYMYSIYSILENDNHLYY